MLAAARLPGIRIDVAPPPIAEGLPPMDVAVFVGFAAAGPVHLPVAVDGFAQYRAVFGLDPALAFDSAQGERICGHLGPAVSGFFANGGRRCWVIRVARTQGLETAWARVARRTPRLGETATANRLAVPGVLAVPAAGGALAPAEAQARSLGSWSDGLWLSAALLSDGFALAECAPLATPAGPRIRLRCAAALQAGDLIELGAANAGLGGAPRVFAIIDGATPLDEAPSSLPGVQATLCAAFAPLDLRPGSPAASPLDSPPSSPLDGPFSGASGDVQLAGDSSGTVSAIIEPGGVGSDARSTVRLRFTGGASLGLPEGHWVRWSGAGGVVWLRADRRSVQSSDLLMEGPAWRELTPALPDPAPTRAAVLTLDLRVADGTNGTKRLTGVGLTPLGPSAWWRQTSDDRYYGKAPQTPASLPGAVVPVRADAFPVAAVDNEIAALAPLAWIPLGVEPLFGAALGPLPQTADSLERDGLSRFDAELFLDPDLASQPIGRLLDQADYLRYGSDSPRDLYGIHAALTIGRGEIFNEASLIAVPDAVQTGWDRLAPGEPLPARPAEPLAPSHWLSHRGPCAGKAPKPSHAGPDFSRFLDCGTRRLKPPLLKGPTGPVPRGVFTLSWEGDEPDVSFILEEAQTDDLQHAREVYRGPDDKAQVQANREGHFYYRVSAWAGEERSPASQALAVAVRDHLWAARTWAGDSSLGADELLRVHRGLLELAAASGELFAVLSLPRHFRAPEAVRYTAQLRAAVAGAGDPERHRALSFGALYHPWVQCTESVSPAAGTGDTVVAPQSGPPATSARRVCPPDGVAAGMLARRAIERGAWVAPANEPLKGLVALTPAIDPAAWLSLQEARVNLIRPEPRGFLCLAADTLSFDADWRAINVRRLFSLLRRLALRRGLSYVFEPNGDLLRRAVERGFAALLTDLDRRGAFAGATAEQSFQVVTSGAINTPADRDAGRFIVELRVAPALPLRFLGLRLLQRGERLAVLEGT